jgi:pimeloyl-ACP methyl ester carboxylesterase
MPTFDIPGSAGAIHVVDLREERPEPSGAAPIVFVHGMVGHTGFWKSTLAACADRRRAVALDLRGHGNSTAPGDHDYSIPACASDVLAVMDALALAPVVLVGHSYGACVTAEVAGQRPDRVRRLVLVDPPGDFTTLPAAVRETELLPYLAALDGDGWREAVARDFEDALKGSAEGGAATVRARLASTPREALRGMFESMMNFRAVAALERYLAAEGSSVHSLLAPSNAWPFSLHNLVPAVTTTVIPDVGHWIMLDAPERFVAALEDVIADT